jgi:amidase
VSVNRIDLQTVTIPQLDANLQSGQVTSVELVQAYLRRIAAFDHGAVAINAVRALTSDALAQAAASDARRAAHVTLGPLDGIPIVLKDNIDTRDAPTTAGSIALARNVPRSEATLVSRLRSEGAVILAKMNMSEFAYWMDLRMPEGYSSLGGQVLNPYNSGDPSGSSSGPGAGEAMAYAAAAIGTETSGSILGPADVESLVAVKPTVGLISRRGVIPLSQSWDTPGPMTRDVTDAAYMLDALAGRDRADPVFDEPPGGPPTNPDYVGALHPGALRGARLGYSPDDLAGMSADQRAVMTQALHDLAQAGAKLVPTDQLRDSSAAGLAEYPTIANEFKYGINRYLANEAGPGLPVHDLTRIILYNQAHPKQVKYGQSLLIASDATLGIYDEPTAIASRLATITAARRVIDSALSGNHLDAYLSPNTSLLPGVISYPNVAAAAQYPTVIVPMGFVKAGTTPTGLGFLGTAWSELRLLALAYDYERLSRRRELPTTVNPKLLQGVCNSRSSG